MGWKAVVDRVAAKAEERHVRPVWVVWVLCLRWLHGSQFCMAAGAVKQFQTDQQ